MTPALLTERLLLRPFEHDDSDAYARLMGEPAVARGVCAEPLPFTRLHAAARILMVRAAEAAGRQWAWAAEDGEGDLSGAVTIDLAGSGTARLGFAVRSDLWGQGLGREMLEAVLSWQRRTRPELSVDAVVFDDAAAAARLLAALGFEPGPAGERYSLARGTAHPARIWTRAPVLTPLRA